MWSKLLKVPIQGGASMSLPVFPPKPPQSMFGAHFGVREESLVLHLPLQ